MNFAVKFNSQGRPYVQGKKDPALAATIVAVKQEFPLLTQRELAVKCKCSAGFVNKVLNPSPMKSSPRNSCPHVLGPCAMSFLATRLDPTIQPPISTLRQIRDEYANATGESYHISSFSKLMKKFSKLKGNLVDPRKWSSENVQSYLQFAHWQQTLSDSDAAKLCFFDEARVDLTRSFYFYFIHFNLLTNLSSRIGTNSGMVCEGKEALITWVQEDICH